MAKAPGPTPPGLVGDFAQYLRDLLIQAGKPDGAVAFCEVRAGGIVNPT
jgi:hypothetical protein